MDLRDKVVIINEGTNEISRAIAHLFVKENAKIVLAGKSSLKLESIKNNINNDDKIITITVKDNKHYECKKIVKEAIKTFGKIDILINNYNFDLNKNILELEENDWKKLFLENVISSLNMIKEVQKVFDDKSSGKIITIHESSTAVKNKNSNHWFAIESAIKGITKGFAFELSKYNIMINCIIAGFIETEIYREIGRKKGFYFEEFKELSCALVPLGRIAKPEEIAKLALFLASDFSNFITGQVIYVKGGP